jgi:MFS family permease
MVSAALAFVAVALGFFTKEVPREAAPPRKGPLWHPAALRPGAVLFLGLMPLSAFTPLLPLYTDSTVDVSAGLVFLVYGVVILAVRVLGARIPDNIGARRTGALALVFAGAGMLLIAGVPTVAGLLIGTVIFAFGMSLMYPALLLLALVGIPDSERASVVGTFSSFFDLSSGFGAIIAGAIAEFTGYRGAFLVAGVTALAGLIVLRGSVRVRAEALA